MRKLQDRVQKAKDQVNLRAIKQSYHFPFMHAFIALGWLFEGLTVHTETKVIPLKCTEILAFCWSSNPTNEELRFCLGKNENILLLLKRNNLTNTKYFFRRFWKAANNTNWPYPTSTATTPSTWRTWRTCSSGARGWRRRGCNVSKKSFSSYKSASTFQKIRRKF